MFRLLSTINQQLVLHAAVRITMGVKHHLCRCCYVYVITTNDATLPMCRLQPRVSGLGSDHTINQQLVLHDVRIYMGVKHHLGHCCYVYAITTNDLTLPMCRLQPRVSGLCSDHTINHQLVLHDVRITMGATYHLGRSLLLCIYDNDDATLPLSRLQPRV